MINNNNKIDNENYVNLSYLSSHFNSNISFILHSPSSKSSNLYLKKYLVSFFKF